MIPRERRAQLVRLGIKQVDLARLADVSASMISYLLDEKTQSLRVQKLIAQKARIAYRRFWSKNND